MFTELPVEEADLPLNQLANTLLALREEAPGQFTDELLGLTLPGLLRVMDESLGDRDDVDDSGEPDLADD